MQNDIRKKIIKAYRKIAGSIAKTPEHYHFVCSHLHEISDTKIAAEAEYLFHACYKPRNRTTIDAYMSFNADKTVAVEEKSNEHRIIALLTLADALEAGADFSDIPEGGI